MSTFCSQTTIGKVRRNTINGKNWGCQQQTQCTKLCSDQSKSSPTARHMTINKKETSIDTMNRCVHSHHCWLYEQSFDWSIIPSWCCSPWVCVWLVVHRFLSSCTCHCVHTDLPGKPDQMVVNPTEVHVLVSKSVFKKSSNYFWLYSSSTAI